jgi:hypothetical protein
LKRHNLISWFACVFGLSVLAHAQATPTASRPGALQVGAGFTYVWPDYTMTHNKGITVYGTYDVSQHIGIEADLHFVSIITPGDVGEDTYLIGPRYVFHHQRFNPYAKALFGLGRINYQFDFRPHSSDSTFAYAIGGGLDYHLSRSINIRAIDFEYQQWPGYGTHGLSPMAITVGAAYNFH